MKNLSKLTLVLGLIAGCAGPTGTTGRGAEVVSCTAGLQVNVACGALGLGSCSGDPTLRVCDAALAPDPLSCAAGMAQLGFNDDYAPPNRCPGVMVTCPASGRISVLPGVFSGVPNCNWVASMPGI